MSRHRLPDAFRRAYDLGAFAGLLFFVIGAGLIAPFAFYAGWAVGNGASAWLRQAGVSFLAFPAHVLGLVLGAGIVIATSGLVFAIPAWLLEAAVRLTARAISGRHNPPAAGISSGV